MRLSVAAVVSILFFASVAHAGPGTITYQGSVRDSGGNPVPDGVYAMRFTLYDHETSGVARWTETDAPVHTVRGLFSTILGDDLPFTTHFARYPELWLEVAIDLNHNYLFDADEVYSPRQQLTEAPWAIDADTLDGRHSYDLWRITGNPWTVAGSHFLGTTDDKPLEFRVNNSQALRLEPDATCPNLIGGFSGNNVTEGVYGATIGGGGKGTDFNRVTDNHGTVSGGHHNRAGDNAGTTDDAESATVCGGSGNSARAREATVGGGRRNAVTSSSATICGGFNNNAGGAASTIGGGSHNIASGSGACVPGGSANKAAGRYSLAAGRRAKANHDGAFVWADSYNQDFASTRKDQFAVQARGGAYFGVNHLLVDHWVEIYAAGTRLIDTSTGGYLSTGGNWVDSSDQNKKENLEPVNPAEVLARLAELPITTWNYKTQAETIRHMGPAAQDFRAAFGLGEDDRHIAPLDTNGVALAAIQGLHRIVREKDERIAQLEARLAALEARIEESSREPVP